MSNELREKILAAAKFAIQHGGKLDEVAEVYEDANGVVHCFNAKGGLVFMTSRENYDALVADVQAQRTAAAPTTPRTPPPADDP